VNNLDTQSALMVRDDQSRTVSFTQSALEAREMALAESGLIGKVTSAAQQESAVAAQAKLQQLITEAEKARKAIKEPVLQFGQLIDGKAREFKEDISEELVRLARLIGDYQALEQAKARAAEALRQEQLSHIEMDKLKAAAQATSHEQLDAINQHYNDKAAILAPVAAPVRAAGQVVKPDWEIKVNDIWMLARAHPACVNIEPRISEIKSLLNAGVTIAGVTATRITKSSVRLKPTRTIEV